MSVVRVLAVAVLRPARASSRTTEIGQIQEHLARTQARSTSYTRRRWVRADTAGGAEMTVMLAASQGRPPNPRPQEAYPGSPG
jgi:hypothetical protein